MSQRSALTQLELMVLLAVIRLQGSAYGITISEEIQAAAGRSVALASVYAVLERLETKRFVSSRRGMPTAKRGGKARIYFKVTEAGVRVACDARAALTGLFTGLPATRRQLA